MPPKTKTAKVEQEEEKETAAMPTQKVTIHYDAHLRHIIERAIDMDMPVLMVGDTGTGKTSIIRELAKERNKDLIRLNLTGQTSVDELVGKLLLRPVVTDVGVTNQTYWVDGPLITAMRNGWWIVLDEVNMALPEILSRLHSLMDEDRMIFLAENDGEVVRPADGFRIFGTMNPSDDYAGTKELNKAFLSRFSVLLNIEYSDKEIEILVERTKIEPERAAQLVMFAREVRNAKGKTDLSYTCSTRDLLFACQLAVGGVPFDHAVEMALINKAPKEEHDALKRIAKITMGKEIKFTEGGKTYKSLNDMFKEFADSANVIKTMEQRLKQAEDTVVKQDKELNDTKQKLVDAARDIKKKDGRIDELEKQVSDFLQMVEMEEKRMGGSA